MEFSQCMEGREGISAAAALGVPDESPAMPERKELSEVLRFR